MVGRVVLGMLLAGVGTVVGADGEVWQMRDLGDQRPTMGRIRRRGIERGTVGLGRSVGW